MRFRSYNYDKSFIDLLFNIIAVIAIFFIVAFVQINIDKKNNEGLETKAEYLIAMRWPSDIDCDVDLWVRNPSGGLTFFKSKDVGFVNLERDDLGDTNDLVNTEIGMVRNPENYEYTSIRKTLPGEYTVNIHLYSCHSKVGNTVEAVRVRDEIEKPLDVVVEITRLNPIFNSVFKKIIKLTKVWEEKTVVTFNINEKGEYTFVSDEFTPLVEGVTVPGLSGPMDSMPGSGGGP